MPRQTAPNDEPAWGTKLVRVLIVFWLFGDILFLILAANGAYSAPGTSNRFFIWFYAARLAVLIGAAILARVRRSPRFYVPVISDVPDVVYWAVVLMGLTAMRFAAAGQFAPQNVWLQAGEYGLAITAASSVLMFYQGRIGTVDKHHNREWRISKLQRKAGLSKAEFEAIAPHLVDISQRNRRTPWVWSLFALFVAVVSGAMLNTLAAQLVTAIEPYFQFSHVLFP